MRLAGNLVVIEDLIGQSVGRQISYPVVSLRLQWPG